MAIVKRAQFDNAIKADPGLAVDYFRAGASLDEGQSAVAAHTPEYGPMRLVWGAPTIVERIAAPGGASQFLGAVPSPLTGERMAWVYLGGNQGTLLLLRGDSDWTGSAIDITPTGGSPSKTGEIDLSFGSADVSVNYVHTPGCGYGIQDGPAAGCMVILCKSRHTSGAFASGGVTDGVSLWYYNHAAAGADTVNKWRRVWPNAATPVQSQVIATPGRDRTSTWSMSGHFDLASYSDRSFLAIADYTAQQSAASDGFQLLLAEVTAGASGAFTFRRQLTHDISGVASCHLHSAFLYEATDGTPVLGGSLGDGQTNARLFLMRSVNGLEAFFTATADTPIVTGTLDALTQETASWVMVADLIGDADKVVGLQHISLITPPEADAGVILSGCDEAAGAVSLLTLPTDPDDIADQAPVAIEHTFGGPTGAGRAILGLTGRKGRDGVFYLLTPGTGHSPTDVDMNASGNAAGYAWFSRIVASPDGENFGVLCRTGSTQAVQHIGWDCPASAPARIVMGSTSAALGVRSVDLPGYLTFRGLKVGGSPQTNYARTTTGAVTTAGVLFEKVGALGANNTAATATVTGGNVTGVAGTVEALPTSGNQLLVRVPANGNNTIGTFILTSAGTIARGPVKVVLAIRRVQKARVNLRATAKVVGADTGSNVIFDLPAIDSDDVQFVTLQFNSLSDPNPTLWSATHGVQLTLQTGGSDVCACEFLLGVVGVFAGSGVMAPGRPVANIGAAALTAAAGVRVSGFNPRASTDYAMLAVALTSPDGPDHESADVARDTPLWTWYQDERNYIEVSIRRHLFTDGSYDNTAKTLDISASDPGDGGEFTIPASGGQAIVRARGPATNGGGTTRLARGTYAEATIADEYHGLCTLDPAAALTPTNAGDTDELDGVILGHDYLMLKIVEDGTATYVFVKGADYNTLWFGRECPIIVELFVAANGLLTISASVNGSTAASDTSYTFGGSGAPMPRYRQFISGDVNGTGGQPVWLGRVAMLEDASAIEAGDLMDLDPTTTPLLNVPAGNVRTVLVPVGV